MSEDEIDRMVVEATAPDCAAEEAPADCAAVSVVSSDASLEEECVVCFKNVEIYSIGECDHPVCYECSTRMRVLCQQNECPICRHVLLKVLFTYDKLPYRELEARNRSEYYNKRYKIGFYNAKIQDAFFELLDHPCPKCTAAPYRTFQGLKNHVRKEHHMHYCDLCVEHLKIFTFERRCYTQAELTMHRNKGDLDNRSHRGHPLCEHCNKRYLDTYELFRHLRRDHYFCHFCDADGRNEFYSNYVALADHFRTDHFLCEEGRCATEEFVSAFRSEIDFKAHVASVHGKTLNKQQAKQTRTLQLEITLGPRNEAMRARGYDRVGRTDGHQFMPNVLPFPINDEAYDEQFDDLPYGMIDPTNQLTIDASNELDFPSLGGLLRGQNVSLLLPPPQPLRYRSGTEGLARTRENFPALGNSGGGNLTPAVNTQRTHAIHSQAPPISSVLRKAPSAATGAITRNSTSASNGASMVIHVSNRPQSTSSNSGNSKMSSAALEFPALPLGKTKRVVRPLDEDTLPSTAPPPMANLSAKHRMLVDDYVSVANPSNFQKLKTVKKEEIEAKARKAPDQLNAPKLTTEDFPSLSGGANTSKAAGSASTTPCTKPISEKKQRELENRKGKIAPPPILPKDSRPVARTAANNNSSANVSSDLTATKKEHKKNKDKKSTSETALVQNKPANGKQKDKEKNNNGRSNSSGNNNNSGKNLATHVTPMVNGNDRSSGALDAPQVRPPPGFPVQLVKPPPGLSLPNVTVNSVAKSPNSLTFTSSLGESYSIVPTHVYVPPADATARNQQLVGHFKAALATNEALEEFRSMSQKFREGVYKTDEYYQHCREALKDKFDEIFPELLAMLPDISKQQTLYLAHTQYLNSISPIERKSLPKLEVCSTCKQVMLPSDAGPHQKLHHLKDNFPTLAGGGGGASAVGKGAVHANRK